MRVFAAAFIIAARNFTRDIEICGSGILAVDKCGCVTAYNDGMRHLRTQLLTVADAYGKARSISRARVSTIVFNAGATLDKLAQGKDLNTGSFEKAMHWFSVNWPEGAKWPQNVERPKARMA